MLGKKEVWFHSGSNRGSFACEANGLTNFPMEPCGTDYERCDRHRRHIVKFYCFSVMVWFRVLGFWISELICGRYKKEYIQLLSTGLEPMTLALSEPRATNCAKRAK